jgi:hypothetical protein
MWDIHQPIRTRAAEYRSEEIYVIGSHYQVTTGEDTADLEDLMHVIVNCKERELVIALWLPEVMSYMCSVHPITNRNPIYSHLTHDIMYEE